MIINFNKNNDYQNGNYWLKFNRTDIVELSRKIKIQYEKIISVRLGDNFFEYLWMGDSSFYQVKVLRQVFIPYRKEGKNRCWFPGKDGTPLRWTGISNIFYMNNEEGDNEEALEALLDALSSGIINPKYCRDISENNEKIIGFCPILRSLLQSEN